MLAAQLVVQLVEKKGNLLAASWVVMMVGRMVAVLVVPWDSKSAVGSDGK